MAPAELVAGGVYAFVLAEPPGQTATVTKVAFAGTLDGCDFRDTCDAIAMCRRGRYYLTLHCALPSVPGPTIYGLWTAAVGGRPWDIEDIPGFRGTGGIHDLLPDPPEAWRPDGTHGAHKLVVPIADWGADPRLHVADWMDPAAECAAAGDWVAEEARLRTKRDEAMRRALGF